MSRTKTAAINVAAYTGALALLAVVYVPRGVEAVKVKGLAVRGSRKR